MSRLGRPDERPAAPAAVCPFPSVHPPPLRRRACLEELKFARSGFDSRPCPATPMRTRRVVSLTHALTGQNLQDIMHDLCAVLRERDSDARHAPRSIATTLISVIEQLCRHLIALWLSEDDSTMPSSLTIDIVSMPRTAGMPLAVLVSFTYNFQSI